MIEFFWKKKLLMGIIFLQQKTNIYMNWLLYNIIKK